PEFTQIDMEMSFVSEDDVMEVTEGLLKKVFKDVKGLDIKTPFERMTYTKAMDLYGSDKPDTRFEMLISDISDLFENTDFKVFKEVLDNKGIINAIVVKGGASKYSRKDIDKLQEFVKAYGAKALAFLKYNDELTGSIVKFTPLEIIDRLNLENDDLVLVIGDKSKVVKTALGALRVKIAKDMNLIDENKFNFLWVTDFPMFEYSEEEGRYLACHHPFTLPKDVGGLDDRENAKARAYDIVLNGYEAGGGSLRIHDPKVQEKVLEELGFTKEEANERFGFLINALHYGTPPHGGLAIGLERLCMIICGTDNIRDVIAFPKTASASDLMMEAPDFVDESQLEELSIQTK
ncbi:MAG TPA: aspartate--tRNA ligase, partial [Candidatus Coprosoma intestinipullorum]|nr:aspartate--tRNA ligase [Candidatus Coprosoma intestinipullorum]